MKATRQLAKIAGVALLIATQAQAQPLRRCVEVQRQMKPIMPEGYIWRGDSRTPYPSQFETGVKKLPAGYKPCPPDGPPPVGKITTEDISASVRCCNGSKQIEGCTAGTIMFSCNPKTGERIELVSPSKAQMDEWLREDLVVPMAVTTTPHK